MLDNYVSRRWRKSFGLETNWLKNLGDDETKKSFNVSIWSPRALVDLEGNSRVHEKSHVQFITLSTPGVFLDCEDSMSIECKVKRVYESVNTVIRPLFKFFFYFNEKENQLVFCISVREILA